MAHVILFEHAGFHGAHKHVFRDEPNLNAGDDNFFNDKTSLSSSLRAIGSFLSTQDTWESSARRLVQAFTHGSKIQLHSAPDRMIEFLPYGQCKLIVLLISEPR